ncbi:MAG TPA: glycerophosphodiester phosphodiesterase family protein [Terriglobales bacterium]|nr:glycerophosphodiester phosphodiesterase family protein [Terriglobales bacterium]
MKRRQSSCPASIDRRLKLLIFIVSVICITAPNASADQSATSNSQWTVRGHVPVEQFIIQSHRGAGELAPENTIEAFELAWKLGTWPESDLRTTKDGVIVAFHDATFERTVKNAPPDLRNKGVQDVTFTELSKLDVGGWKGEQFEGRRVSRISDVFKLMRGRPERHLYLDIKNVDLNQLSAEVKENGVAGQIVFATTNYQLLRDFKKLVPEAQTLNWMGGTEAALKKRIEELSAANFEGITQLQLHVRLNPDKSSAEPFNLSRKFIRATGDELRRHDIVLQILPWDVNEAEVYWQLLDLGAMSFATDHPDVVVKAVRDFYSKP